MLKAYNDRQSVLHLEDELERLKVHAIAAFDLPVNEKILFTSKATYRCVSSGEHDEEDLDQSGTRAGCQAGLARIRKIRVIVMSNHLILDPEIFGPTISASAEVILCNQLHSVTVCVSLYRPIGLCHARTSMSDPWSSRFMALCSRSRDCAAQE